MSDPTPEQLAQTRDFVIGQARGRAEITLTRHPLPTGTKWLKGSIVDFVGHLAGDLFDDFFGKPISGAGAGDRR